MSPDLYPKYIFSPLRRFAQLVYNLFGGFEVRGAHHIPKGGCLIVSNHISLSDPVAVLVSCPRPVFYMAAAELLKIPYFGAFIKLLQAFPVKRGSRDSQALNKCRQLLEAGEAVVMYPEGGLSRDLSLHQLYPGAVLMALKSGCPIIPAVMMGSADFLPYSGKFLHYSHQQMRYGPALYLGTLQAGCSVRQQVEEANLKLRRAMQDLYQA